ncbi:hypothetical protein LZ32DRAFT_604934 [Colletotrichum eremochloae]|nr:hypothetical protein LZ32DRAFT_604934 [Colletotrichum eremochloae]
MPLRPVGPSGLVSLFLSVLSGGIRILPLCLSAFIPGAPRAEPRHPGGKKAKSINPGLFPQYSYPRQNGGDPQGRMK